MTITCPLFTEIGKRRIHLNLNQYRNLHYQINNKAKIEFAKLIYDQVAKVQSARTIEIVYTLFPGTSRLCDVPNTCSIVDKFFSDTLVKLNKLPDDNYLHLPRVIYQFGEVDRGNGRVEANIITVAK